MSSATNLAGLVDVPVGSRVVVLVPGGGKGQNGQPLKNIVQRKNKSFSNLKIAQITQIYSKPLSCIVQKCF